MGRLGGVECSMIFSSLTSLEGDSVPPCASLVFVDTGIFPLVEACVGEVADEGASTVLLLVWEGDAWK